jgi:hypothetical protein
VRPSRAWLASPSLLLGLASHRTCLPARSARFVVPDSGLAAFLEPSHPASLALVRVREDPEQPLTPPEGNRLVLLGVFGLTIPLSRFDPSIAPHEIDLAADPEPPARVVPSTSRASTPRFPTRTRQFGTTLVGFLRRGSLRGAAASLVVARPALRTSVGVPFA